MQVTIVKLDLRFNFLFCRAERIGEGDEGMLAPHVSVQAALHRASRITESARERSIRTVY